MSDAAASPPPPLSRAGQLLGLVRKLIDYGKDLAGALRQRGIDALNSPAHRFGTLDVALILARITHGLHLAAALEARVTASAARLDAEPKPSRTSTRRASRPQRADAPPSEATASVLATMPTPEQIAAEVRRRPIGAVLADICRDLGILPCDPLWRDLQLPIIRYCGNYARLVMDILGRPFSLPGAAVTPDPSPPLLGAPVGTGPP